MCWCLLGRGYIGDFLFFVIFFDSPLGVQNGGRDMCGVGLTSQICRGMSFISLIRGVPVWN